MKQPRFILADMGLILETPIPLSNRQREVARTFAITEYKRRLVGVGKERRESLVNVITKLIKNDFIERAIPAHDCDKETLIYGK